MVVIVLVDALATMRRSFLDHLLGRSGGLLESLYGVGAFVPSMISDDAPDDSGRFWEGV